jgi:exopolysaccharide biosynthesis polyprenyl glycosylphosphotransferase
VNIFLNKKEAATLLIGDLVFLIMALWGMLFIRYLELPSKEIFLEHFQAFAFLFIVWLIIFYIFGLYEKQTLILKESLIRNLIIIQIVNSMIAIAFFYFIPIFGISPKINLFIYLIISFALILFWRLKLFYFFTPKNKYKAILIGSGQEMIDLEYEINNNSRYNFYFTKSFDLSNYNTENFNQDVIDYANENEIGLIVVDLKHANSLSILSGLYDLIFANVQFLDKHKVYEAIFDRVPISILDYDWFLENISPQKHTAYNFLKRSTDVFLALFIGFFSLFLYPIVYFLIKKQDGGSVFFKQKRVGKDGKTINLIKFRTMSEFPDKNNKKYVTKIGNFLRKTRIDELPQLLNVLKGDLSIIGPRPETIEYVDLYTSRVPYYNIRHLIRPGLSGWAQIYHDNHPHHESDVSATKEKLSYDLFYIKNRSVFLDFKIIIKTIRTVLTYKGK